MTDAPSPFSIKLANFQTTYDSTSLGWLKNCPAYYHYQMILKWQPRRKGLHLAFGGFYASGVEHFFKERAKGLNHDEAVISMVKYVLGIAGERDEDGMWHPWNPDPDHPDAKIKNRYTLIRTLVWNVEDRKGSAYETIIKANGKPAIEESFNFYAFDAGDEPISLSGHLDAVVKHKGTGDTYILDDKAQPLWSKVLFRDGWKTLADLKVGDEIAGTDGSFHKVTAIHPKGVTSVYRVEFHDHSNAFCADAHLWTVIDHTGREKTLNLTDLLEKITTTKTRFRVPLCKPIQHPTAALPVDPYLLGALLGDGHFGGNSVQITSSKTPVLVGVTEAVARMGDVFRKNPADNLCWTITNNRHCATLNGLKKLGLWGCLSADKFIPDMYLFSDIEQRRALLKGLLDTDGSWAGDSRRYQTMSENLAEGVAALVRSVGGIARVTLQPRNMYRVILNIGERKGRGWDSRYIKTIHRVEDQETVCISVSSPDHLYLTDRYIATHNTTKSALNMQYFKRYAPDNQVSLYSIAGKIVLNLPIKGVLIRAAQILVEGSRFATQEIPRNHLVLEEWLDDTKYWVGQAQGFARDNRWPRNDKSCNDFGGCAFQDVCNRPASHRAAWLREDFTKREWNPLASRGE